MAASFVRAQSSLLWHTYSRALEQRPLLTKIATGKWQGASGAGEPKLLLCGGGGGATDDDVALLTPRRAPPPPPRTLLAATTTTTQTGVLGTVLGDSIAQHTARHMLEAAAAAAADPHSQQRRRGEQPPWRFDFQRTARLCAYSALLGTPIAHAWFGLLDKGTLLPAFARSSPGLGAACKTLLDQLLMAPVGLSLFFASVALMEGKTPQEAAASASARLKPALVANYALWPGAQAVNFALVPPRQRILYVNVVAIFWTAVLSHLASSSGGDAAAAAAGGVQAAAAAGEEGAGPLQLPLPIPPEPVAARVAGAPAGGGGARRRSAPQKQQKAQQKAQQQAAAADEAPPDTFVPVVP
jgi:protein Mpv17